MSSTAGGSRSGMLYGIGAYSLWGLIPLYFKAVRDVPPLEILAHRAAWSFVVLAAILCVWRRWGDFVRCLADRRSLVMLTLSAVLVASNWLTFIYAVLNGRVLEASLGYFLNPLVNVMLGVLLLKERLRRVQMLSIGLAIVGVGILTAVVGMLPWISLVLAATFALYGLLRKTMPASSLIGLAVETLLLLPIAGAYLFWLHGTGRAAGTDLSAIGRLAAGGLITSIPLLLFAEAARRLPLSTLGIFQYLTPSLQFALAVLAFGEPFSSAQIVTFGLIWAAVGLYLADMLRAAKPREVAFELVEPD